MHIPSETLLPQARHPCARQSTPQALKHGQACQEIYYTSDQHAEQGVLSTALFPNILHLFRVSAVTQWPVYSPINIQDTNKMRRTEVKTIYGGKLCFQSRSHQGPPSHPLSGQLSDDGSCYLREKEKCTVEEAKGLFLRKSTI